MGSRKCTHGVPLPRQVSSPDFLTYRASFPFEKSPKNVVGKKPTGYCWRTYFEVLDVPFLVCVSPAFLPSKKACGTDKFRHFGVRQQYPTVSLPLVAALDLHPPCGSTCCPQGQRLVLPALGRVPPAGPAPGCDHGHSPPVTGHILRDPLAEYIDATCIGRPAPALECEGGV
jgi:hypothetical protein